MAIVETQEQIENIAKEIGKEYKYKTVKVKTSAYMDFKVRWTRSYQWIDFIVSDYLIGLSEEAISGMFDTLFSKIMGGDRSDYGEEFVSEVFSQAYLDRHRPTYIKRNRIKDAPYQEFDDVQVYFKSFSNDKAVGYSAFFRTIFLNDVLKDAPKDILETLIADTYNTLQDAKQQIMMDRLVITDSAPLPKEDIEKAENYLTDIGLEWC